MRTTLTATQTKVLTFLHSFVNERQYAPTVREIATEVGVEPSSVAFQLRRLQEFGYIRRAPKVARGLVVLPPPEGAGV